MSEVLQFPGMLWSNICWSPQKNSRLTSASSGSGTFEKDGKGRIFFSLSFSSKTAVSLQPLSCVNIITLDSSLNWNGVRPRNIRARYLGNELCLSSGNELLWCTSNSCRLWESISPNHFFIDDSAGSSPFIRADFPILSSDRIYFKKILLSLSNFFPLSYGRISLLCLDISWNNFCSDKPTLLLRQSPAATCHHQYFWGTAAGRVCLGTDFFPVAL